MDDIYKPTEVRSKVMKINPLLENIKFCSVSPTVNVSFVMRLLETHEEIHSVISFPLDLIALDLDELREYLEEKIITTFLKESTRELDRA